jgi:hypothetical protein
MGSADAGATTTPAPIAPAASATTSFLMVLLPLDRCFSTNAGGWGLRACSCRSRRAGESSAAARPWCSADSHPGQRLRLQARCRIEARESSPCRRESAPYRAERNSDRLVRACVSEKQNSQRASAAPLATNAPLSFRGRSQRGTTGLVRRRRRVYGIPTPPRVGERVLRAQPSHRRGTKAARGRHRR